MPLGLLLAVQLAVTAAMAIRTRLRAGPPPLDAAADATTAAAADECAWESPAQGDGVADDERGSTVEDERAGKCALCLGPRVHAAATPCGHIFCWACIGEWCNTKVRRLCSLHTTYPPPRQFSHASAQSECPLCRQALTPQTLVRLYNY
jgi:hypothetical protein